MIFSDPLIGRQLANFRIERLLGRGGMAKVYYGWDVKLQRAVAVKVIREEFRSDPAYTERFVREARMVATWQHANIPQIYHAGEEEGISYFAMEYVRGENLDQLLKKYTRKGELMPYGDVLQIGKAVAEALDYAHQRGVIHRDVTPANVMLSEDDRIMLTDFGLARAVLDETLGEVLGSPHYVSPEQARNSADAVPQSDIYSLGVILYEMLVGDVPFEDDSPTSLVINHITAVPPSPREINPDLSETVEKVLLKALRKSPQERYQTGMELMGALERALAEEEVDTAPSTLSRLPEKTRPIPTRDHLISTRPAGNSDHRQKKIEVPNQAPSQREDKPRLLSFKFSPLVLGGFGCGILLLLGLLALITGVSMASIGFDRPTETRVISALITHTPHPGGGLINSSEITPSGTPTKTVTQTATRNPSATPTSTPTHSATPGWDYELVILTSGDDSLFLVNEGEKDFPVKPLKIKGRSGEVSGEEWEVEFLEEGECVAVWKDSGKPKAPKNLECDQVGERLDRGGSEKFWTASYEVLYDDKLIETCSKFWDKCELKIRAAD